MEIRAVLKILITARRKKGGKEAELELFTIH